MSISSVSSYSSVFQSPGTRPVDYGTQVQPVQAAQQQAEQTAASAQQDSQQTNTNPTDNERQEAINAGRSRGNFVNITA